MLLHCRHIRQRDSSRHAIEAGEAHIALRILNDIAIEVRHRPARADLRCNIFIAEESIKASIASWLIGQQIRATMIGVRAQSVASRTVNADTNEIGLS